MFMLVWTGCYCSVGLSRSDYTVQTCASEEWGRNLREWMIQHRVLYAFASFTVANMATRRAERCIQKYPFAKHLDRSRIETSIACFTRVYFAPILGLGFAAELYRWLSGCSFSDAYIYTCASWSATADAWEWVRRWPTLLKSLILHHFGVLTLTLVIVEFPFSSQEWSFQFVLFFANTALQWTSDYLMCACFFAHDIRSMQWNRRVSLWSGVPRALNVILLAWIAWNLMQSRAYLALVMTLPLNVGYIGQTTRDWYWAYCFDAEKYFAEHQRRWLAAESHAGAVGRAE